MITQTYDDWCRMLHACARAATGGSAFTPERVLAVLSGDDLTRDDEAMRVKAVAAALGIDRRRRLEWKEPRPEWKSERAAEAWGSGRPKPYGSVAAQANGTWMAAVNTVHGQVAVTGHPTRESAIEHLERLLGRLA